MRRVPTVTREVAYFKAFSTRLATTWPTRSGSASQRTSPVPAVSSSMDRPEAAGGRLEGLRRLGDDVRKVERARVQAERS